ncbi:MAG: hypothetical protein QOD26_3497 [Betaproteobacteria bacterium]|jgi:hypothetical protein|nr:hypothetical protein [Betaproteobacteria bacterium]
MRLRRSFFTSLVALAAIVFAQTAMALASWDFGHMPCHDESAPTANVCASHCANNDLTLDTPRVKVPVPAALPAPITLIALAPYPQIVPIPIAVLPAGPPPRILFHSFLI